MRLLTTLERLAAGFQRRLRVLLEIAGGMARLIELAACRAAPTSPGIGETPAGVLSGPGCEQERNPGSNQCPEHNPHRD